MLQAVFLGVAIAASLVLLWVICTNGGVALLCSFMRLVSKRQSCEERGDLLAIAFTAMVMAIAWMGAVLLPTTSGWIAPVVVVVSSALSFLVLLNAWMLITRHFMERSVSTE